MKKLLLAFFSVPCIYNLSSHVLLKDPSNPLNYLDYVFPQDSLAGFRAEQVDSTILAHHYFGIEYKVMMYKMKRDFVNAKYGYSIPNYNQIIKGAPNVINPAPL